MSLKHVQLILSTLIIASGLVRCTSDEPKAEEPVRSSPASAPSYDDMSADAMEEAGGDYAAMPVGNTERYSVIHEQGFVDPAATPLSTFSIDVDTAGYSLVRRFLNDGQLPPSGAVRIEEMLNYFDYRYKGPKEDLPFAVHAAVAAAPWQPNHRLVRIGIKGKELPARATPAANLVFLIDVSGSMDEANKLPLLKRSLALLVKQLRDQDSVGIVVYAGASGVVLEPTSKQSDILDALTRLQAGGSTNGAQGIEAAYRLARENFKDDGINRVILATDGDFNVGITSESELVKLIEAKAKDGIYLSVLGFGSGNYNDSGMEQMADHGDGNYAYIDTLDEARKVMVQQLSGTLVTIAKDVKIQVEFNPELVDSYRLIGYENRALAAEDFNDDKKDAGEIGAGHTVTALYEVVPKGATDADRPSIDKLRYQTRVPAKTPSKSTSGEMLTVKVRYKEPNGTKSHLLTRHVMDSAAPAEKADSDFRFAAAVATFGMKLRGSEHARNLKYDEILKLAKSGLGDDEQGFRAEFVGLVRKAETLDAH